jgi:hypothetical protein
MHDDSSVRYIAGSVQMKQKRRKNEKMQKKKKEERKHKKVGKGFKK